MNYSASREKFIETWGTLGSQWGINKSIAQIQALLLIAPSPLTTDDIMEELKMSRGNASMSIRQLLDWGIIYKKSIAGDRKEYFIAEKVLEALTKMDLKYPELVSEMKGS